MLASLLSVVKGCDSLDLWIDCTWLARLPWQWFPGIRSSEQTSRSEVLTSSALCPIIPAEPVCWWSRICRWLSFSFAARRVSQRWSYGGSDLSPGLCTLLTTLPREEDAEVIFAGSSTSRVLPKEGAQLGSITGVLERETIPSSSFSQAPESSGPCLSPVSL